MSKLNRWKSGTALLLLLGLTSATVTPMVTTLLSPAPAVAQNSMGTFRDVPAGYWAKDFIEALAVKGVIAGFRDGSFRPEDLVTRAQFAAMLTKAFQRNKIRNATNFVDIAATYWANSAIQNAYQIGFLAGYPKGTFQPEQNIPREQVLVSLANGLNYAAKSDISTGLQVYNDSVDISGYARNSIVAATEKSIVVNYPNREFLNPKRNATRAEVAAFIYQALVSSGEVVAISSPYIIVPPVIDGPVIIPSNTSIPVRYEKQKILVMPEEKAPLILTLAANITTPDSRVLIPANSQVIGQLQPATGGSQFVASELILTNGKRLPISATSQVITKTEEVKKGSSTNTIIKDTILGAAAAAGIAAVTGDRAVATEEVLGGAGVGALIGLFLGRDKIKLIVIEPNTDLNLKLDKDLLISK